MKDSYVKPIIGIVGRSFESDGASVIELNEDYRLAVVKAGGLPVILVPTDITRYGINNLDSEIGHLSAEEKTSLLSLLELCDGFLITGGSRWYEFDEVICTYAINNDVPILGICLGMQIMASMDHFCGDLRSDQTIKNCTNINHCQQKRDYVHKINILPGKLMEILDIRQIKVNSRHDFHVEPKDWFIVDAYSEDGLIEAIDIPNHSFALGVQWHPENMIFYDPVMLKLFKSFVNAARSYKNLKDIC